MNRTEMRELAFKLIYETEIQKDMSEEQVELFVTNNNIEDAKIIKYLKDIVNGIETHKEDIIKNISENLKEDWDITRISKINLALLKISLYEMLYADVPYKVAINEVIELEKKYADEQSPIFINGVLASVVKKNNLSGGVNN